MTFQDILKDYEPLRIRAEDSANKLSVISNEFRNIGCPLTDKVSIFAAGSLGRQDMGSVSDLDIFVVSQEKVARLEEVQIIAVIVNINNKLHFPPFSNDAQYLRVYELGQLKSTIGSPKDDQENLFTARMLMLLESKPVFNHDLYRKQIEEIINVYFRDNNRGDKEFRPLFLLNDILRFWRTLCLNYEKLRHDPDKPWRKKNVNLKFSRMLTVFGTILPLVTNPIKSKQEFQEICDLSPLQRLAKGLDLLGAEDLSHEFSEFLENYEHFLLAKEGQDIEKNRSLKTELDKRANQFSLFLFRALMHKCVNIEYKRFLVI